MSVLVIIESLDGKLGKGAFEIATYSAKAAKALNTSSIALLFGNASNAGDIGSYGIDTCLELGDIAFDSKVYTSLIAQIAKERNIGLIIMRHNSTAKNIAGRIAIRLDAGLISGVKSLPTVTNAGLAFEKSVYSGKAIATYEVTSAVKVISVMGNTIQPEMVASPITAEKANVSAPSANTTILERKTISGTVPLPEAELVVSAGRGMKGPENWGIIEELAQTLGATTACSRPVADAHWRPHHEHVGQTGVAIRPNLYFAIGISGAIQHLAGVNSSKTIVVINKDPEAPFFKAADYGVVGDLFEVVPRLNAAIKKLKAG
jgi:electron transfer flavoprotein alpha subunit